MKCVDIGAYGAPEQIARCVEVPDPGPPGPGEVTFEVLASPINPSDVLLCQGSYSRRPPLPFTPGFECAGRVLAIGAGVAQVAPGDLVISLQGENWAQQRRLRAEDVVPLPAGIDPKQAAMLRVNPPTALLMLTDLVDLEPGGWILQNAANSAVGQMVIHFARSRGLRTANVVRREALGSELGALGADACLVDGPDLPDRVRASVGGAPIRLALDAVGGDAAGRLAASVADGGTVCTYGALGGEAVAVSYSDLIFRGVTLIGFWLVRALAGRPPAAVRALYADIAARVLDSGLGAPVEALYPIEEIGAALAHAQRPGRSGKVLIAPNGAI